MNLYFQNSRRKLRLIAQPQTEDECFIAINKFLDEHNYKCHYIRTWTDKNGYKWYDVGSYTEFFCLSEKELDEDEFIDGE